MTRTLLSALFFVTLSATLLGGCNRASWGSSSGWEVYYDPDAPDFELQEEQTQGSYTPLNTEDEEATPPRDE